MATPTVTIVDLMAAALAAVAALAPSAHAFSFDETQPVAFWELVVAVGVLGFVHAVIKQLLDRRRSRAWAREWSRVEPRWRTGSGDPFAP